MTLYIKVTQDKFELPIAVADTARELADMVGTSKNTVYSSIWHEKNGNTWSNYKKVEVEE